jgi:hypothetical protein
MENSLRVFVVTIHDCRRRFSVLPIVLCRKMCRCCRDQCRWNIETCRRLEVPFVVRSWMLLPGMGDVSAN